MRTTAQVRTYGRNLLSGESLRISKRGEDLYHERWELELGYDEIKTDLLDHEEAIRGQKPDGVRQELWGILLAYNLVRLEMDSQTPRYASPQHQALHPAAAPLEVVSALLQTQLQRL